MPMLCSGSALTNMPPPSSEEGATLVEYVMVAALGLVVMLGLAALLETKSLSFGRDQAIGFEVPYPRNYIDPPP